MTAASEHIRALIEKAGALTVADYMQLALQHPQFGYYRHGNPLGQGGDFITAPEISQMFGEMIGLWCADIWHKLGSPKKFALLEMGPGHGTLMHDALRATQKIAGFHDALQLLFLETSETLHELQMEQLRAFNPAYIADLSHLPPLPLIAIANEFFDALPIRQLEKTFAGWCERLVTVIDGQLAFTLSPPDEALKLLVPESLRNANPGPVHEFSPISVNLIRDLAQAVARNTGAALIIDYGYAAPDGQPTLQAVADHKYTDPLATPGEADITALVDFHMLKQAAEKQGATTYGPIAQGDFLRTLGIETRADQLKHHARPEQELTIDQALHRLTNVAEMGSLFKALAIISPNLTEIPGF